MKKHIVILSLFLIACSTDNEAPKPDVEEFNDPNWLKLEIPNGKEAYSVAGNIDDTLLVSTWMKTFYTTDQGKTWIESRNFNGPVMGLLERNDTIFPLLSHAFDEQGYPYASLAEHFTVDHGNSWKYGHHPELKQKIGRATSSTGIEYVLKENTTPVSPGSASFYVNPTEIMKHFSNGPVMNLTFPYKHKILNLHVDSEDRLYIAASGGVYQEQNNSFYCCTDDRPAIVYVSKYPIP
jgi:hypothetical protein